MTETTQTTTREEFEAKRLTRVTLEDGTTIQLRRTTVRELVLQQALPLELMQAWQNLSRPDGEATTPEDAAKMVVQLRVGLTRVAVALAISPPISETYEPPPSPAIWAGLLSLDELTEIYLAVTGRTPMGAAAAESFRAGATAPAAAAAPDGKGVRPEAEQLDPGGSVDLQHM